MNKIIIKQTRIAKSFHLPKSFNKALIELAVQIPENDPKKAGLNSLADCIVPDACLGNACKKNALGEIVVDKTKPKELRYVCSILTHPFGNKNASEIIVDINRECYQRTIIPPTDIMLSWIKTDSNKEYVKVVMTNDIREHHIIDAINLMLNIYGECIVFRDSSSLNSHTDLHFCNWTILPQGMKPSEYCKMLNQGHSNRKHLYDEDRLKIIENLNPLDWVIGSNGFKGYIAYKFIGFCIVESAVYGNATYFIPEENWLELTKKTKQELLNDELVLAKIIHSKNWYSELDKTIKNLNLQDRSV